LDNDPESSTKQDARGELGVMARAFDGATLLHMVRETATSPIREDAERVLDEVAEEIRRGML
jgi:hypothetical protein